MTSMVTFEVIVTSQTTAQGRRDCQLPGGGVCLSSGAYRCVHTECLDISMSENVYACVRKYVCESVPTAHWQHEIYFHPSDPNQMSCSTGKT